MKVLMKYLSIIVIILLVSCNKGGEVKSEYKYDYSKLIGKVWKTGIRQRTPDATMEFYKGDSGVYHRMVAAWWNGTVQYDSEKFLWHPVKPDSLFADFGGGLRITYHVVNLNDTIIGFDMGNYLQIYSTL